MGNLLRPIQKPILAAIGALLAAALGWLTKTALDEAKEAYGWQVLPVIEHALTFFRVASLFAATIACAIALGSVVWWYFQLEGGEIVPTITNYAGGPISKPPRESKRKYLDRGLRPLDIVVQMQGRTSMQIAALVKPYVGKWMRLRGTVELVSDAQYEILVTLRAGINVTLSFRAKEWRERFYAIKDGDEISFSGQIAILATAMMVFRNCELIDVGRQDVIPLVPEAPADEVGQSG